MAGCAIPPIAINDTKSKYLFDNRYGTGQSTWTTIMHLPNMNIAVKTVVVIDYGWFDRGVALWAKGLGAEVIFTEIDSWKTLEARMDGFKVIRCSIISPILSREPARDWLPFCYIFSKR